LVLCQKLRRLALAGDTQRGTILSSLLPVQVSGERDETSAGRPAICDSQEERAL
jgi:hypothetical protein